VHTKVTMQSYLNYVDTKCLYAVAATVVVVVVVVVNDMDDSKRITNNNGLPTSYTDSIC